MPDDSWPSTHLSLLLSVRDPENSHAWTDFVSRYRGSIVSLSKRLFGIQDAIADDIAQGVLLKLVKEMQRFEYNPNKSFSGWLKTVTKNSVLDYFRKENRRFDIAKGDLQNDELLRTVAARNSAEDLAAALSRELQQDLVREAEQLVQNRVDGQTWKAYHARSKETPARDIAAELGMKVAAVHKAKSRVLQMIREEIAGLLRS